jgi:tripartite-type tricarboxylate transporter receptor subunit TctC
MPAKTLAELIIWVRSNQDHISVATGGVGTSAHIAAVFFEVATGTRF